MGRAEERRRNKKLGNITLTEKQLNTRAAVYGRNLGYLMIATTEKLGRGPSAIRCGSVESGLTVFVAWHFEEYDAKDPKHQFHLLIEIRPVLSKDSGEVSFIPVYHKDCPDWVRSTIADLQAEFQATYAMYTRPSLDFLGGGF